MSTLPMGPVPSGPVAGGPVPPVRRFRDWLFASVVLGLAATLAVVWGVWVTTRTGTYPTGVQNGGTWTDPDSGMELSVVAWEVRRWLPDGDAIEVAPEGMVYLTVLMRWKSVGTEGSCAIEVVGRGQETWDENVSTDDMPYSCVDEDLATGSGVVYHNVLMPEAKVGEVRGVRHPRAMMVQQGPLLRPPA